MNMKNVLSIHINEFFSEDLTPKRQVSETISIDPTVNKESIRQAIDTLDCVKEKLEKLLL